MRFIALSCCLLTAGLSASSVNAYPASFNEFRADQIRSAFQHAWKGYSTFAYGHDELLPVSGSFSDSRWTIEMAGESIEAIHKRVYSMHWTP
ncbi:hypothetical protein PS6_008932 [Mucor atramentarius]